MTIGENVKRFREQKNMSQRELASKVLVSSVMINNVEHDKKMPSVRLLKDLAVVFGCKTDDLLETEENEKSAI